MRKPGLYQASIADLHRGRISRDDGYLVITMRRYPRFVRRELRDEYIADMAPPRALFEDWLEYKRRTGDHEGAFVKSHYEKRFVLNEKGVEHLARLAMLSRERPVFLLCQCEVGKRCHRELLILMAKKWLGAEGEGPYNRYPVFESRMKRRLTGNLSSSSRSG